MINIFSITATILLIISSGLLSFHIIRSYREVERLEEQILRKKSEIDGMIETILPTIRGSLVTQSQLEKMAERRKEPLIAELEILKMKRQFILDKIPLLSFFKR